MSSKDTPFTPPIPWESKAPPKILINTAIEVPQIPDEDFQPTKTKLSILKKAVLQEQETGGNTRSDVSATTRTPRPYNEVIETEAAPLESLDQELGDEVEDSPVGFYQEQMIANDLQIALETDSIKGLIKNILTLEVLNWFKEQAEKNKKHDNKEQPILRRANKSLSLGGQSEAAARNQSRKSSVFRSRIE